MLCKVSSTPPSRVFAVAVTPPSCGRVVWAVCAPLAIAARTMKARIAARFMRASVSDKDTIARLLDGGNGDLHPRCAFHPASTTLECMVLVLDNYDSFTYNLVQYLGELGAKVEVYRNDELTVGQVQSLKPERI